DRDERSSLAIHVCFLRETGSSTSTTRNMEETGVLEKVNLSGFCYLALNQVRTASETHAQSRAGNSLGRSPPETTPEPTGRIARGSSGRDRHHARCRRTAAGSSE